MALGRKTGGGSRKGKPNKTTQALKEVILGALDDAGGQEYLVRQAQENPVIFINLLGKLLPSELRANVNSGMVIQVTTGVPRRGDP